MTNYYTNYSIVLFVLEVEDSKPKKLVFKENAGFGFLLIWPFILLKLFVKVLDKTTLTSSIVKNANSTRYF